MMRDDSRRGCLDAHVYGAFNLAFGLGSALGPVIGGPVGVYLLSPVQSDAHEMRLDIRSC